MTWVSNLRGNMSINNAASNDVVATPVTGADHAQNASALLARAEASFAGKYVDQMRDVGQGHLANAAAMYAKAAMCFEQLYTIGQEQGMGAGRS